MGTQQEWDLSFFNPHRIQDGLNCGACNLHFRVSDFTVISDLFKQIFHISTLKLMKNCHTFKKQKLWNAQWPLLTKFIMFFLNFVWHSQECVEDPQPFTYSVLYIHITLCKYQPYWPVYHSGVPSVWYSECSLPIHCYATLSTHFTLFCHIYMFWDKRKWTLNMILI